MPGVRNLDANLMKNFQLGEGAKLTFRCEVFNVLNHPQIWSLNTGFTGDNPGSSISSSVKNFGTPSNFREARIVQLALRLAF